MKANKLKSSTEKATNIMIVVMIVVGTVVFALTNKATSGNELMPKLFLAFFGAIIAVQLIPGLILLGSTLKGVFGNGRKQEAPLEEHMDSNRGK